MLRNRGNFYHNEQVKQTDDGELILLRRPPAGSDLVPEDYGPCPQCLGYVVKDGMSKHAKYRCIARTSDENTESTPTKRNIKWESEMLVNKFQGASHMLKQVVLSTMKRDRVYDIAKNDPLILELGSQVPKNQSDRKHIAAEKMRRTARIVQRCRRIDPEGGVTMNDFIKPGKFGLIIQAVEEGAGQVDDDDEVCDVQVLERPSYAIKAGYDLAWLAKKKRCQAIRNYGKAGSDIEETEATKFLELFSSEWGVKVSSSAANTLNLRKREKRVSLPTTTDLKTVSAYLVREIEACVSHIPTSYTEYCRLQKLTLTRLVIFNKRRPREVSKVKMKVHCKNLL